MAAQCPCRAVAENTTKKIISGAFSLSVPKRTLFLTTEAICLE
jgi:hypothetical protein